MSLRGNIEGYPCLRDYYVPLVAKDPSESTFVDVVFGDLRYWLRLKKSKFMAEFLEEWGEMADIERKKLAFAAVINEVENNGRSAFTAAKYLIEEPWKDKRNPKVKETNKKTTKAARNEWDDDVKRLEEQGLLN